MGVAHPRDTRSAALNPANMAEVGERYDIALTWINSRGQSEITGNSIQNGKFNPFDLENTFDVNFGINYDCGCWSYGFIVYERERAYTQYDQPLNIFGTTPLKFDLIQQIAAPTFTYHLNKNVRLGVAIDIVVQSLDLGGLQDFDNSTFSNTPGSVNARGREWAGGLGATLGILWEVNPCLSLGFAYQPEIYVTRFQDYKGFVPESGRFNVPETYSAGIAYRPVEKFLFLFDIQHFSYSDIRAFNNSLPTDLTTQKLGTQWGAAFGWRDTTLYRAGVEWDVNCYLTLRGDYSFRRTPIRSNETAWNLMSAATTESSANVGFTWHFWPCWELSVFYTKDFANEVHGSGSIPSILGNGEANLRSQKDTAGFSLGKKF